jgi:hypothetical protein
VVVNANAQGTWFSVPRRQHSEKPDLEKVKAVLQALEQFLTTAAK